MKTPHPKAYLVTWSLVLYVGGLIAQFSGSAFPIILGLWGLLFAGGVVMTSVFVNWEEDLQRRGHSYLLLVLAVIYVLSILSLTTERLSLLSVPLYLWWSIFLSLAYISGFLMFRRRSALLVSFLSLLVFPLFFYQPLVEYLPLLFGLGHASMVMLLFLL